MRADTKAISIHAKSKQVVDFLSDPTNLPRWAVGFAKSVRRDGDRWIVTTGGGEVSLRIVTEPRAGVVDYFTSPGGAPNELRALRSGSARWARRA